MEFQKKSGFHPHGYNIINIERVTAKTTIPLDISLIKPVIRGGQASVVSLIKLGDKRRFYHLVG